MPTSRNPPTPPPSSGRREVVFDGYRLDLEAECLYRGDRTITLRPKAFAVLRYLVAHPHVLVTKPALLDAVWPGVAVTESTLTKSIGEIRDALQDDPQQPRYLETVHRRGFRFLPAIEMPSPDRPSVRPPERTHTVGREGELARLDESLQLASAGDRQVVFVTGEAGIGKTTLVKAFLAGLPGHEHAPWIATGQCVRHHGTHEPYMPVLEALGRLAQGPHRDQVLALLRRHAPSWLVHLPWLTTPAEQRELSTTSADTTRERLLRMFLQLVDALTAARPLVLILEDLHWADPSTLDLVGALGQRHERAALVVVGTYRAAEALPGSPLDALRGALDTTRRCREIPLGPLPRAAVAAYLANRFGGLTTGALADTLHRHTDGHPLFLTTAVDHLLIHGMIEARPNGLAATADSNRIEASIPHSLRELTETLVATLGDREGTVLEAASVVGVEFAAPAVAAALAIEDVDVEEVCERLARTHRFLVRRPETGIWHDGTAVARYAFMHALYQRGFYDRISPARRQLLHRRIGHRLEDAYGPDASVASGEIAAHFERGNEPLRAIRYLGSAAHGAERRCAPRETAEYARRALRLLEQQPTDPAWRRQELDLRCSLVAASVVVAGFSTDEGWANYLRARELAADERDATQLFRLLYAMFLSRIGRGDGATAPVLADELQRAADRLDVAPARHIAKFARSYLAFYRGRHRDAAGLAELREIPLAELDGFFYGSSPAVVAGAIEGFRRWLTGRPEQACAMALDTVASARQLAHPINLCMALAVAGQVRVRRGDLAEAAAIVAEGRVLAEEYGIGLWGPVHLGTLGMVHARRNEPTLAAAALEQALTELRASGNAVAALLLLTDLADTHRVLGRIDEGLANVTEGLDVARHGLDPSMKAELWRARGELLLASGGGRDAVAECFHEALALARRDDALAFELRAATAFARFEASRSRRRAAIDVLAPILARFSEGHATADVHAADQVLRSLTLGTTLAPPPERR